MLKVGSTGFFAKTVIDSSRTGSDQEDGSKEPDYTLVQKRVLINAKKQEYETYTQEREGNINGL